MERINRDEYIVLVNSLLGKGEAVVLTGRQVTSPTRLPDAIIGFT